jgi:hypothetical protein
MKFSSIFLKTSILILGMSAVLVHARVFVGVGMGFNFGPYPYAGYAYPVQPTYMVPAYPATTYISTPTVVESQPVVLPGTLLTATPTPAQPPVWYFCDKTNAYYPYVQTCEVPWKTVPATPPKP